MCKNTCTGLDLSGVLPQFLCECKFHKSPLYFPLTTNSTCVRTVLHLHNKQCSSGQAVPEPRGQFPLQTSPLRNQTACQFSPGQLLGILPTELTVLPFKSALHLRCQDFQLSTLLWCHFLHHAPQANCFFPSPPPLPISLLPELNSVSSLVWLITATYPLSLSVVLVISHSQTGLQPEELSLGLCRTIAVSPTAMLLHIVRCVVILLPLSGMTSYFTLPSTCPILTSSSFKFLLHHSPPNTSWWSLLGLLGFHGSPGTLWDSTCPIYLPRLYHFKSLSMVDRVTSIFCPWLLSVSKFGGHSIAPLGFLLFNPWGTTHT